MPIHAYPVVAKINCPPTLDFGMVPIGQELEKTFSFSCDVPIQFEYKLASLDANSDFTISPMLGIIPAEGTVQVRVLFRPTRLYTSLLKVQRPYLSHSCTAVHVFVPRFPSVCPSSDSAPSRHVSAHGFLSHSNVVTTCLGAAAWQHLAAGSHAQAALGTQPTQCSIRAKRHLTLFQVEDPSYMGPRTDKIMTAVHDAARDKIKQQQVCVIGTTSAIDMLNSGRQRDRQARRWPGERKRM